MKQRIYRNSWAGLLTLHFESVGAKTRISIAGELVAEGGPELEQASGANGGGL